MKQDNDQGSNNIKSTDLVWNLEDKHQIIDASASPVAERLTSKFQKSMYQEHNEHPGLSLNMI